MLGTGLDVQGWFVFFGFCVALALLLEAALQAAQAFPATRLGRMLLMPALVAVALATALVVLYRPMLGPILAAVTSSPLSVVLAGATLIVALALISFLFGRVVPLVMALARAGHLARRLGGDAVLAALHLVTVAGVLTFSAALEPPSAAAGPETSVEVANLTDIELAGQPMDIAFDGSRSGYVSVWTGPNGEGAIVRFELPSEPGGDILLRTVAERLEHPRGIAISNGHLFVAELGPLPCRPSFPSCTGARLRPEEPGAGEIEILRSARGRISRYPILPTGMLQSSERVVSDLPVVNTFHGLNGMTVGPDGDIYLPIGGVDELWPSPQLTSGLTPNEEWLGAILLIPSDGGDPTVYAAGLRNVYQVAFDERGQMWAVDNDGPTIGGWRAEEVLPIQEGQNYGYPIEGTYGPYTERDGYPIWVINEIGSAGLAWRREGAVGPGLLIGACDIIVQLSLVDGPGGRAPFDYQRRTPTTVVSGFSGCVTSIATTDEGSALATVFSFGEAGHLYLIRFVSTPHFEE